MNDERNFWIGRKVGRRAALRGAAVGMAGLAGAALIGCGDDDEADDAPAARATQAAAATATEAAAVQSDPGNWPGFKRGGTYISTIGADPASLDPYRHLSYLAQYTGSHSYGRLLKFHTGPGVVQLSQISGDLAESFELSDGGLKWVFKLRPGVTFHNKAPLDGRLLDAEDVMSSFARFREISPNVSALDLVESMESPDERTIVFNLTQPFAPFEELIASPNVLWIMSKEANEGDIDPSQPDGIVGTGPWIFRKHRPSVEITYDANPDYYVKVNTPDGPADLPLMGGLQYLIMSEYAQQLSQFVAGRIQAFTPRNADIKSTQEQVEGVQSIGIRPGWLGVWHSLNKESNNGLFADERARRALSMSLDRDGLLEAFGELSKLKSEGIDLESGWTTTNIPWGDGGMFWWLDPKGASFGPNGQWYQFNPAESQKLLDAAGYDGEAVQMNFVNGQYGSTYDQFTEAQIPMLRDGGFKIQPKPWEYRRMIGSEESKEFPGIFYNYGTPYTSVDEYVFNQFVSDSPRIAPLRRHSTPELEDLTQKQRVEFDREARQEIIHNIQRISSGLMTAVPSVHTRYGRITLNQPEVRNYAEFRTAGYGFPAEHWLYIWLDT